MTDEEFTLRKLFLIEYESSHWITRIPEVVVVHALDLSDAMRLAHMHMQVTMRNRYTTINDHLDSDELSYIIISVERFTEKHPLWSEFYYDWVEEEDTSVIYPIIWSDECHTPQKFTISEKPLKHCRIPTLMQQIPYKKFGN